MCGFAGIYRKEPVKDWEKENINEMSKSIHYRGPDDSKLVLDDRIALAFRRLSIIDLEKGSQPFTLFDGKIIGIFNGEIYNYRILRDELIAKGESFTTNSEIEVMLKLFYLEGPSFINRLRGMFAFAFYNKEKEMLMLGRDPFGIKPLYLHESENGLVFASETKPFFFDNDFAGFGVDKTLLQHYFTYQYVPEPKTLGGIDLLPAGHYAIYDVKAQKPLTVERYYDPMFNPNREMSFEDKAALVRKTLEESVKAHMISDVDVGTFLSSGIDSTIITALASKLNPGIKAFTVAFGVKEYSEIDDATAISKHLDVEHIKLIGTCDDFKNAFEKVVWHLDSPVADPSTVAIYLICREAARHLKVVLSGEGADELFGGYKVYGEQLYSSKIYSLPGFIKSFLAWLARILPENVRGKHLLERGTTPLEKRYVGNAFIFNEQEKKPFLKTFDPDVHFSSLTAPVYQAAKQAGLSPMLQMQYVDMHTWIRGDILTKGDRLSMAHSLEVRVPFLDREVFRVASMLSDDDKLSHKTTKYILRYAFRDLVDEATFMRPKLGYPVPVRAWLKNELYDWAKDIIENSTATDYIVTSEALKMLDEHRDGTRDNYRKLWTILVFITWYRLFVTDAEGSKKKILDGTF